jgi:hypothetical protein
MFQLYSHHQACLQSLVELRIYTLNACAVWDPSIEAKDLHVKIKIMKLSAS